MTINQMVISPFDKLSVTIQDFCKSLISLIILSYELNFFVQKIYLLGLAESIPIIGAKSFPQRVRY
jgi:hypothetical protein